MRPYLEFDQNKKWWSLIGMDRETAWYLLHCLGDYNDDDDENDVVRSDCHE